MSRAAINATKLALLPAYALAPIAVRDVKPFVNASASVTFNTDGTLAYTGNQSTGPASWVTPTGAGVGSGYWVRFIWSGAIWDGTSVANGVLYSLASARTLTWSASSGVSKSGSVLVQLYRDVNGTQLVTSGVLAVYSSGMN